MQILLIHRYFWPDTSPYGILLRRIAEHFATEGNDVNVFTGEPTYNASSGGEHVERTQRLGDGLTIRRARLLSEKRLRSVFRALNDLIFCFRIIIHVWSQKPDVVMCSTQPPVLGAFCAGWAARQVRAKFVYHLQDIYPEVICETGHVRKSLAMRLLKAIDLRTVRRADRVVVLSQDMRESMIGRAGTANVDVALIPNMNLPQFDEPQTPLPEWTKRTGVFRLMFAGNIGRFQNLDTLVEACLQVPKDKPFELVLMGDGKAKEDLRLLASNANDDRIKFIDRQPLSIAEPLMADADLCVVSLEEQVYQYAFPSKLASYLSLGTAVLVVCEKKSELSRLPVEYGFGLSCAQSPASEISKQIEFAIDHPNEVVGMRRCAESFFAEHFSAERVLPQWTLLFESLLASDKA
ncbi:MAG: glycosyltransferase family 4 protein [Rubripirellula sp.]